MIADIWIVIPIIAQIMSRYFFTQLMMTISVVFQLNHPITTNTTLKKVDALEQFFGGSITRFEAILLHAKRDI